MFITAENQSINVKFITQDNPTAQFAAEEFKKYMKRICKCGISDGPGAVKVYIGSVEWINDPEVQSNFKTECPLAQLLQTESLKWDGYSIAYPDDESVVITSKIARGLLYAVYDILRFNGCRWFIPGPDGEYVPSSDKISLPGAMLSNPDFEIRNFTYDGDKSPLKQDMLLDEMIHNVDYFAKVKANAFFIHGTYDPAITQTILKVGRELKRRGMLLELGGHGVHNFVDRKLFSSRPDLFRESNGERKPDGNFCSSNPEALKLAVDGAADFFESYSEVGIDVLHLWFDDVMGGSWCSCEKCKNISPEQQQLNVVNAIARKLDELHPGTMVDMLLYHDTMKLNFSSAPEKNVYGYFAPRERCRRHSIGDECCKSNNVYMDSLKKTAEVFGDNAYIFEYYADMILFMQLGIFSPRSISNDLKQYLNAGVNKISCLMFGRYSWWAYGLNMYCYAGCAWDVNFDYRAETELYCKLFFDGVDGMNDYFLKLETASELMQAFCEYDYLDDMRNIPPQSLDFYKKHLRMMAKALGIYKQLDVFAENEMSFADGKLRSRLKKEHLLMRYSIYEAEAIYDQMMGRYLNAAADCGSGAESAGSSDESDGEKYIGGKAALEYWMDKAIERRKNTTEWFNKNVPISLRGVNDGLVSASMIEWNEAMRKFG